MRLFEVLLLVRLGRLQKGGYLCVCQHSGARKDQHNSRASGIFLTSLETELGDTRNHHTHTHTSMNTFMFIFVCVYNKIMGT